MPRYAATTEVSADRSKAEIERTLTRYGANQFVYGWSGDVVMVAFQAHGRFIRFHLPMPAKSDFAQTPSGRSRKSQQTINEAWEQAARQRWRALALVIKAKLEAVESGIATFENEFLAYMMLPDGQTVGAWVAPQIALSYKSGQMPELLPGLSPPRGRS